MRDKAVAMLMALGVAGAADDPLLDIVLNNVQWRIKNLSNLSEIPEGLESLAVSMAVGEYLNMKKCSGQLEGFDLDAAAVKSIQEGDTNISFALGEGSSTPEQRLNSPIDYLINGCIGEIYRYRQLVWYVEYGHRQTPGRYVPALGKTLKASWVKGRFMLTISEQEVKTLAPSILNDMLYEALKGVFS